MTLLKLLTRLFAFTGKEVVETLRRPGAIVSLTLGPFLILLAFGLSFGGVNRILQAIVVVPPSSGLPTDVESYSSLNTPGVEVAEVTADEAGAKAAILAGRADLAIVAPEAPQQALSEGRQARIHVYYYILNPVQAANADFLANQVSAAVNRQVIRQVAIEGQQAGLENGVAGAGRIPPDVIAQPTVADTTNLAPTRPAIVPFFGLAAVALILQHIAVTLIALALVRERGRGRPELFRLAPTGAGEIVAGKLIAFLVFGEIVSVVLVATLLAIFAVPILGSIGWVVAGIALLLLASLAYGTFIAAISDSERQAVQLSLLMLLTAVFFGGFVLPVDQFSALGRGIAAVLPVTHGIAILQGAFLRGDLAGVDLLALGAIALLIVPSTLLLRRSLVAG